MKLRINVWITDDEGKQIGEKWGDIVSVSSAVRSATETSIFAQLAGQIAVRVVHSCIFGFVKPPPDSPEK